MHRCDESCQNNGHPGIDISNAEASPYLMPMSGNLKKGLL